MEQAVADDEISEGKLLDPCKSLGRNVEDFFFKKERENKLNKICILLNCGDRSLKREGL